MFPFSLFSPFADDDWPDLREVEAEEEAAALALAAASQRPLVSIQPYMERSSGNGKKQQRPLSSRYKDEDLDDDKDDDDDEDDDDEDGDLILRRSASQDNKGKKISATKKELLARKNSFHELQNKFKSLERKQKEPAAAEKKPVQSKMGGFGSRNAIQQKLERVLNKKEPHQAERNPLFDFDHHDDVESKWPKSDKDTGYVSRDKSRSRDFDDKSPNDSMKANKRLESYLGRQQQSSRIPKPDEFLEGKGGGRGSSSSSSKVKRQESKCSSIVSPPFRRNMEAVGEFEKVWAWQEKPSPSSQQSAKDIIPLTQELSPEYHKRSASPGHRARGRALSPVERRSRNRSPENSSSRSSQPHAHNNSHHNNHHHHHQSRGLSSPPELRRGDPHNHHNHRRNGSSPPRNAQSPYVNVHNGGRSGVRRAMSPEMVRRSSSRGGAFSPDPVRILRREKTSVFDNRYPSLDQRSDKRKSLYELQDDVNRADLRRRSYHELGNRDPLPVVHDPLLGGPHPLHHHPPHQAMIAPGGNGKSSHSHNFQHSGKKSSKEIIKSNKKQQDYKRYPGLDLSNKQNPGPPPPPQVAPPPPMHHHPHHHHHPAHGPWQDPRVNPHFYPHGPPPPQMLPGRPHPHHHGSHPAQMGRYGIPPMRPY